MDTPDPQTVRPTAPVDAIAPAPPSRSRPPSPWRTLLRFSLAAWRACPAGALGEVALVLLSGALPAATLWAGRGAVDAMAAMVSGRSPRALGPLLPWAAALAALAAATHLAAAGRAALTAFLRPRVGVRLERALLEAASGIDLAAYEQADTFDRLERSRAVLGYRLTNILVFLTEIGVAGATLAAYTGLLWAASPYLALAVALPAVPSMALKVWSAREGYVHDYDAAPVRRRMGYMRSLLLGASPGQEVRLFGLTAHLNSRWNEGHRRWRAESLAKDRAEAGAAIGTTAAQVLAYAVAVAVLAGLIAHGRLSLGAYVVLTGAAAAFQGELEGLLWRGCSH